MFNSISQRLSGLSAAEILAHTGNGEHRHAERLRSDPAYQKLIEANKMASKYPELLVMQEQQPSAVFAALFAEVIEKPRVWTGEWSMKGLALALGLDIIVIHRGCFKLFTKSMDHGGKGFPEESGIQYPCGANSRHNKRKCDVPVKALQPATIFVVFNNNDHFCAALRHTAPPTEADIEALDLCIDRPVQ